MGDDEIRVINLCNLDEFFGKDESEIYLGIY